MCHKQDSVCLLKAWVPAHCLHSIRQTGGPFTLPPPPVQVVHSSRVNTIHGVSSRFFHPDPEKWKSPFSFSCLSRWLQHTLSHQLSSRLPGQDPDWRTERRNSFHPLRSRLSPPEQGNKVPEPRSHSPKFLLMMVWENVGVGVGVCLSRPHMAHMFQTCTLITCAGRTCCVWLQCDCRAILCSCRGRLSGGVGHLRGI